MTHPSIRAGAAERPARCPVRPGWLQRLRVPLVAAALLATLPAAAHTTSDSYLVIDTTRGATLELHWEVALNGLGRALGLPDSGDAATAYARLAAHQAAVDRLLAEGLGVAVDGRACQLLRWRRQTQTRSDGAYLATDLHSDCPADGRALVLDYRLFATIDPLHRGLLRLRTASGTRTAVLGGQGMPRRFELGGPGFAAQVGEYFVHGVWHIWQGLDHVLFLLALLLPSVLQRRASGWEATPRLRLCLLDVLRVVTAFTVAHSITLSLAALGLVMLPARLVESTIAASVLLAALNNLRPLVGEGRWKLAFAFGLIHGFGFASVLTDLGLPRAALGGALLGFNLGVEAGQLAIVLAFIPLAWPLRATLLYRRGVLGAGSVGVAGLAGVWLIERVGNLHILPFTV